MPTIHLHNPNIACFEAFVRDPEWKDRRFWMLNTFAYHTGREAAEANRDYRDRMTQIMADVGARLVMQAKVARTVIGASAWDAVAIVEYPSPGAFYRMATSDVLQAASGLRKRAFLDQFLIPISAGWMPGFDPDKPVQARAAIRQWRGGDFSSAATSANAFVGEHRAQATEHQAEALLADTRFQQGPVWMLNLLKYAPEGGKARHDAYAAGGGDGFPGGSLGRQFGLRVRYSARRTFATLIGPTDWNSVAIVSYPTPHHFLSMGANEDFMALHEGRKAGLSETYIVGMQPVIF